MIRNFILYISLFSISLFTYAKQSKINEIPPGIDEKYKYWAEIIHDEPDKFFRQWAWVFEGTGVSRSKNYGMYVLECGHSSYQYFDMPNPDIDPASAYSMPIDEDKVAYYLYKELCPSLLLENVMKRFR